MPVWITFICLHHFAGLRSHDLPCYLMWLIIVLPQTLTLNGFGIFIPYYGLFLCDIQVCDLRIEINQVSGDQSVWHHNGHSLWHYNRMSIVMSQWVMTLLCVHIIESQCIMPLLWTSFTMYALFYAQLWYFIMSSMDKFMFDQSRLENIFVVFV